ncbi:unnamed protein product [Trichogramma brassicae]|uniref:Uncharacterized protein n=1 Tax=Trichogramma brassicae TaxID=86971 RepID=A0A6H5HS51_9HYME|nr:unnamed protein product [Trichogramma brassicae]
MAQSNQKLLKLFEGMPEKVNRNIEGKNYEFLRKLYPFVRDYKGHFPNLSDIFQPEAIDWFLSESVKSNDSVIIDFVIQTGYKDKPKIDKDGKPLLRRTTAVHEAARLRDYNLYPLVDDFFRIYNRFDLNYTDESGLSHFHIACKSGCDDVVKKFLDLGQDPNCLAQKSVDPPLHQALGWNRHKKIAELLLRRGADPNLTNVDGLTPLHIICQTNHCDKDDNWVEIFFKINDDKHQSVQIDAQDKDGKTPLHLALCYGDEKLIGLLLKRGASPNLANVEGSTSLHIICRTQRPEDDFMEVFFKLNDDIQQTLQVNARDKSGNTPLHVALPHYNNKTIESLLRRGGDPNLANNEGSTPLHIICQRQQYQGNNFAELFFRINDEKQQSVQVDARNKSGRTPLQLAVANLLPDVVDLLLDHGAELSSFVFPTTSYFIKEFRKGLCETIDDFKFRTAFCALSVVERLEKRGYELNRSDALTIMNTLCARRTFYTQEPLEIWLDREEFVEVAKNITFRPSLSLYDVFQLRYEEAVKKLTYTDYCKFHGVIGMWSLCYNGGDACVVHLCEIMWRGFFRRWALDPFLELTRYRLPILCCDMIIKKLENEDLLHICLAATSQNTSNLGYKRVDREGHSNAAAIVYNGALRYMAAGYLLSLTLRRDALHLHTKQQRQQHQHTTELQS